MSQIPKKGDKLYVPGSCSISNGSSDVAGGLATVKSTEDGKYVVFEEHPGHSYGISYIMKGQEEWAIIYKNMIAKPDPDIDTPWIEPGDIVNGQVYNGPSIW